MQRSLVVSISLAGLLSGGFFLLDDSGARGVPNDEVEQRLGPNKVRVRIDGVWQELDLMPLADSACHSGDSHLQRYCE